MSADSSKMCQRIEAFFICVAIVLHGWPVLAEQGPWSSSFTTHARTYALAGEMTLSQSSPEDASTSNLYVVIQRVRPTLEVWWKDWAGLEVAYDLTPMFYSKLDAGLLADFAVDPIRHLRLTDFHPELVGPGNGDWRLLHNVDRLNIRFGNSDREIQIGRQAMNHGSARMFPATDFFAPFAPGTIDAEFKSGVDGIRLMAALDEFHEFEFYALAHEPAPNDGISADKWLYLGRWRAVFPELLDLSLLGGFSYGRPTLGLDVSSEWLGAAIYGEISTRFKMKEQDPSMVRATVGADYYWESGLQTLLEVHYSSPGDSSLESVYMNPSLEHAVGEVNLLGRWYLGFSGRYTWQLLGFGTAAIVNLEDASLLLTLNVSYEVLENVSLGLGGMIPFGSPMEAVRSNSMDDSAMRIPDEFGLYPMLGYLDIRAAF